jgi:hypothetical protein
MNLPEEIGWWTESNSLTMFGVTEMPEAMLQRFLKKIQVRDIPRPAGVEGPCWLWSGQTHPKGYGRFYLGFIDGKKIVMYSHRISFEHFVAIPPPGYIIDHECNHKLCCNPAHLGPLSHVDNIKINNERHPYQRRNQYSQE